MTAPQKGGPYYALNSMNTSSMDPPSSHPWSEHPPHSCTHLLRRQFSTLSLATLGIVEPVSIGFAPSDFSETISPESPSLSHSIVTAPPFQNFSN